MQATHRRKRSVRGCALVVPAIGMVCLSLIGGLGLAHGQPTGHGRLLLSVLDPTDALIPHAVVHVARVERAGEAP